MITVSELIAQLQELPGDLPVFCTKNGFCGYAETGLVASASVFTAHEWTEREYLDVVEIGKQYVEIIPED